MFQIKICGVGSTGDARAAVAAGADALGLNFFAGSARCLTHSLAEEIVASLPAGVVKVGLFVNADASTIRHLRERLKLDLIQLHGDEPPEFLAELGERPVMKAFRIAADGLRPVRSYLDRCKQLGCPMPTVLVDAFRPGAYGGTGATLDWPSLAGWRDALPPVQLVLAGGLTAGNVAEAIRLVQPTAVDTASGVEAAPCIKDPDKMRAFVAAARQAFG